VQPRCTFYVFKRCVSHSSFTPNTCSSTFNPYISLWLTPSCCTCSFYSAYVAPVHSTCMWLCIIELSNISTFPWCTGDHEDTERQSKRWICVSKRCARVLSKTADIFTRRPTSPGRKVHASWETSCLCIFHIFKSPQRHERRGKTHWPFSWCSGFCQWCSNLRITLLMVGHICYKSHLWDSFLYGAAGVGFCGTSCNALVSGHWIASSHSHMRFRWARLETLVCPATSCTITGFRYPTVIMQLSVTFPHLAIGVPVYMMSPFL